MVFNPLKNNAHNDSQFNESTHESTAYNNSPPVYDDELLNYDTIPTLEEHLEQPMVFEGNKVALLQEVGLDTISLLKIASKNQTSKQKFNLPLLKSLDLKKVLLFFKATEENNIFSIFDCQIRLEEPNKWFNATLSTGNNNAINLTKHLIAINENINIVDNDKALFLAACNLLTEEILNKLPHEEFIIQNQTTIAENQNAITPQLTYEEKQIEWAKQKERNRLITQELKAIPIDVILEYLGATPNEDDQEGKWKIHDTGHNIGVYDGQKWKNWNTDDSGDGGIDLLTHIMIERDNLIVNTKEERTAVWHKARNQLIQDFAEDIENDIYKGVEVKIQLKETFYMPHVIDFKINDVRNYLNQKRGIPLWIVNKQIEEGLLFAGAPSSWKTIPFLHVPDKLSNDYVWAVFLSVNGENADLRAIQRSDKHAKIIAKGGNKDTGGFRLKPEKDCNEKVLAATEASIDACSYHAIYPGRAVTSCMGVTFTLAATAAIEALQYPAWKFALAFDNDIAGNEATVRFKHLMIEEFGEEEYLELVNQNRLQYFDLGIRCLQETIKSNNTFYFDVNNDQLGKEAATMFQQQLSKVIPMTDIRQLLRDGKLKYANICPRWEKMTDPQYEAKQAFTLLSSDKPYYLRLREVKLSATDDGEDMESNDKYKKVTDKEREDKAKKIKEDEKLLNRKAAFENEFLSLAGEKYQQWIDEGKITNKKEGLKDWNEYFIYMQKQPQFKVNLLAQQQHYGNSYPNNPAPKLDKNKKKL